MRIPHQKKRKNLGNRHVTSYTRLILFVSTLHAMKGSGAAYQLAQQNKLISSAASVFYFLLSPS